MKVWRSSGTGDCLEAGLCSGGVLQGDRLHGEEVGETRATPVCVVAEREISFLFDSLRFRGEVFVFFRERELFLFVSKIFTFFVLPLEPEDTLSGEVCVAAIHSTSTSLSSCCGDLPDRSTPESHRHGSGPGLSKSLASDDSDDVSGSLSSQGGLGGVPGTLALCRFLLEFFSTGVRE